jgi:hypothetical protein
MRSRHANHERTSCAGALSSQRTFPRGSRVPTSACLAGNGRQARQMQVERIRDPRAQHRFRGFPVVRASITYSGEGLRGAMGWIQVVRHIAADRVGEVAVDRFPLGPEDSPLYTYGYLPTFFDAPANPDHPDGVWQADTWLIAIPDVIRSRRVAPITGFRWGYNLESGRPSLLPLTGLALTDWRDLLPALRDEHRRWAFLESTPD